MKREFLFAALLGLCSAAVLTGCVPPEPVAAPSKPVAVSPDKPDAQPEPKEEPKSEPVTQPEPESKPEPTQVAQADPEKAAPAATDDRVTEPMVDIGAGVKVGQAVDVGRFDWPQWGGNSGRNNVVNSPKKLPTSWDVGTFDDEGNWKKDGKNIKWVANLGSQSYGNPVIANGHILIGSNNGNGWLKRYPSQIDLGCLLCFRESDGQFLWQHSSEKLPTGRVHDWPLQGICCAPLVEGNRYWFVTSRGEVVCGDLRGFHDGKDDGEKAGYGRMFDVPSDEKLVAALGGGMLPAELATAFAKAGVELPKENAVRADDPGKQWSFTASVNNVDRTFRVTARGPNLSGFKLITPDDKDEADVIWSFDMMGKLEVSQHNMCSCSVTCMGDLLYVITSNGVDESHIQIPSPKAPSFMVMDKNTGEVYWTDNSPGENILHGQWSSPTVGIIDGVPQVVFCGGDGWVYGFKADKGKDGKPELLWKFDTNPKESKWIIGGRGTRNDVIGTPIIHNGLVYFAVGQDPEHGEGIGHLWCLDPKKRGDISQWLAVKKDKPDTPIAHKRIQAVVPDEGDVEVNNPNSGVVFHYSQVDHNGDGKYDFEEEMHRTIGTIAIKNDILVIPDFSGLIHVLDAKSGKVHWTHDMLAASWGSPLIANDHIYIGDEDGDVSIFKLSAEKHEPIFELNMGSSVYSTPVVANGVLYLATKNKLFAIAAEE